VFCVLFILGLRRWAEARDALEAKLREQLGRDPTDEELFEYLQARSED
jgi:DNA-directed RNA polymerase specialized sigma subunit